MNKTRALLLSLFLTSALILTGCFDEFGGAYDGEDKIAFSADLMAASQANDEPAEVLASYDDTVGYETELIGPHRDSPTEVSFSVVQDSVWYEKEVPTDTGSGEPRIDSTLLAFGTSAEEGTDYQISGTFTLPADSSTANLPLVLLDSPSPDVDTLTLRLDGNEGESLLPAEQLRYLNVIITP